jgi:acetylornithine deacetylase/succinyl-diaminopimelate desuccinylase-like protein
LAGALTRVDGAPPVQIRTMGGSIPIAPFVIELGVPAVVVPTVNPDNNQHSPNENLRLGNLAAGISIYLAVLTEPFPEPGSAAGGPPP